MNRGAKLAHCYHESLAQLKEFMVIPEEAPWSRGVYHLYVVRVADREALQAHLAEAGIGTGIHYPIPLHQQKAYEYLGYNTGDFPVTERVSREIVSLPMFPATCCEPARPSRQRRQRIPGDKNGSYPLNRMQFPRLRVGAI